MLPKNTLHRGKRKVKKRKRKKEIELQKNGQQVLAKCLRVSTWLTPKTV
jgi:hypothetical protein